MIVNFLKTMKFFPKQLPPIPKHKWYAWRPVYAWKESTGELGMAWLEYVYTERINGSMGAWWKYTVIEEEV